MAGRTPQPSLAGYHKAPASTTDTLALFYDRIRSGTATSDIILTEVHEAGFATMKAAWRLVIQRHEAMEFQLEPMVLRCDSALIPLFSSYRPGCTACTSGHHVCRQVPYTPIADDDQVQKIHLADNQVSDSIAACRTSSGDERLDTRPFVGGSGSGLMSADTLPNNDQHEHYTTVGCEKCIRAGETCSLAGSAPGALLWTWDAMTGLWDASDYRLVGVAARREPSNTDLVPAEEVPHTNHNIDAAPSSASQAPHSSSALEQILRTASSSDPPTGSGQIDVLAPDGFRLDPTLQQDTVDADDTISIMGEIDALSPDAFNLNTALEQSNAGADDSISALGSNSNGPTTQVGSDHSEQVSSGVSMDSVLLRLQTDGKFANNLKLVYLVGKWKRRALSAALEVEVLKNRVAELEMLLPDRREEDEGTSGGAATKRRRKTPRI